MVPTPGIKVDRHHLHHLVPDVRGMIGYLKNGKSKIPKSNSQQNHLGCTFLIKIKVSFQGQLHPSISGMQSHPRLWSYWKGCPDNSDIRGTLFNNRRKFRSQTNMDDEKQRWEGSERREEKKREDDRRERVRRKKMQMREKVGKSRNTVFFPLICGIVFQEVSVRYRMAPWSQLRSFRLGLNFSFLRPPCSPTLPSKWPNMDPT